MVKSFQNSTNFMNNHLERSIDSIIEREAHGNSMMCLVKMGSSKSWIFEESILHTTVYKNFIAQLGDSAEHLPEKIVSTAYFGEVQYLVKWQGWAESFNTVERHETIAHTQAFEDCTRLADDPIIAAYRRMVVQKQKYFYEKAANQKKFKKPAKRLQKRKLC